MLFIDTLKETLYYLRKNWKFLPLAVFFDFLFFFMFGSGTSLFMQSSSSSLLKIANETAPASTALFSGESLSQVLSSNPTLSSNLQSFIMIVLLFVFLLYIFWVLFSGTSWKLSSKMLGEKGHYVRFVTKFSVVAAAWFALFFVILAGLTRFALYALLRPEPLLTSGTIETSALVINWVLFYFMLISMSLVPYTGIIKNLKETFRQGIMEAPTLLATYAVIILALFINFELTYFIFQPLASSVATSLNAVSLSIILVRFLIAAPFLTIGRMYLMLTVKNLLR